MGKNKGIHHGHNTLALVLIFIGGILLLDRIGIIEDFVFWDLWPVILVMVGLSTLSSARHSGPHFIFGIGFFAAGVLLLLRNFELIPYFRISWSLIWPVLLILFGMKIFMENRSRRESDPNSDDDSGSCYGGRKVENNTDKDYIDLAAFLGGGDFHFSSKDLKGGNLSAVMGGCKAVLTDADFKSDSLTLNVFAFWGGIEIYIPKNWKLNVKCIPIMGGIEHKIISEENGVIKNKTLIIKGTVIMAGVEIKS